MRRREKHTKDNAMMVLRPAAILLVCRVRALAGGLDYAVREGMR